MKKIIFSLIVLPSLIFSQNYTQVINLVNLVGPNVGGYGSATISINSDEGIFSISFSSGFSNTLINDHLVVDVNYPYSLPDLTLGYIPSNQNLTPYSLTLVNKKLYIGSSSSAMIGGFSGTININYLIPNSIPYVTSAGNQENYIRVKEFLNSYDNGEYRENIIFYDGLGRPKQNVLKIRGLNDIITPITYDDLGRQSKDFLPYMAKSISNDYHPTATSEVVNYYNTSHYQNTINPFSEKKFEASPLNRVLQQAAPGNDWGLAIPAGSTVNHTIKLDYQTNTATEVKLYTATSTWNATTGKYEIALTGGTTNYAANQLYKTVTKDENWSPLAPKGGTTEEFKDKEGHVVLKRTYVSFPPSGELEGVNTYYVYDQYSKLTYVIPPLATDPSIATQMAGLCYQYIHDYRNRLIEKKIPGKQWEFIIYDKLDRPIATGPAFSPFSDSPAGAVGWLITKYDVFNRPVYTGWQQATTLTAADRKIKQDAVNLQTSFSESKTTATTIDSKTDVFYTNNIAPTSFKLLTVNYYDNYDFPIFNPAITFAPTDYNNSTLKPKGMPTGSWVRTLTTLASTTGESSYTLFDYKGRPVKTFISNYLGGFTQVVSTLDFIGKTLTTTTTHKRDAAATVTTIAENFSYTDQDRLLTHTHKVNNLPVEVMATNTYNELGQLISKNVGGIAGAPLQKVDYAYNIRGWLTGINNDPTNNIILNSSEKDLFAFKINYNTVENVTGYSGKELYNGNIAETFWRTSSDNVLRKYGYNYDNLNRLRNSIYMKPEANVKVLNCFNENMNYDKNGNITNLTRFGNYDGSNTANLLKIDELTYNYSTNSNQLGKVLDNTNNPNGFKDGINTNDDFSYDLNGNMLIDLNKGITSIKYNHLNLPTEIVFNNNQNTKIVYLYSADGSKLQKFVRRVATGVGATTNYLSGFQYLNSTLQFFPTAEGYVNNTQLGTVQNFNYVYNFTDIWGNIRMSYSKDPTTNVLKILEENHYYPFGLKHANYNSDLNAFKQSTTSTSVQLKAVAIPAPIDPIAQVLPYQIKYQGQNRDADLGLNWDSFKWRNYDMAIGRFMSIDPISEQYVYNSTYAFQENKMGMGVELEGLELAPFMGTVLSNSTPPPAIGITEMVKVSVEVGVKTAENVGTKTELHHLMPKGVKSNEVIKSAREEGFKFEGAENKVGLEKFSKSTGEGQHGNHPNYNKGVLEKLTEFSKTNEGFSTKEALNFVRGLTKELQDVIKTNPATKINDIFKSNVAIDNTAVKKPEIPQNAPVLKREIDPNML